MRGIAMADETPSHAATVTDFGRALYGALFAGEIGAAFKASKFDARRAGKGLRVRLAIEAPELASLPWEFLYDPDAGDFVCLAADTPLVRYLQVDRPMSAMTVTPPIRVLAMVSSPSDHDRLDVEQERRRVEQATAGLRGAGLLEVVWMESATVDALQKALRTGVYHVFHFVGHGGFDAGRGKGVLIFTDEEGKGHVLDAAMAARILSREDTLRLVVLNACLGSKGSATDLFSSTAATLVRGGVPAVVGMQYEISDDAAIEFARTLYDSIGDGFPIDAAVAEARVKLSTEGGSVEWGTPVLHMRAPDGVLFEINGMTTSEARNTGRYNQVIPRPTVTATQTASVQQTTGASPLPVSAAPPPPVIAPPPAPTPVVTPPPGAGVGGAAPQKSSGMSSVAKVAAGAVGMLVVIVALALMLGGDESTETAVTDTAQVVDSAAAAAPEGPVWAVGFQSIQGPPREWYRVDQSCRWIEPIFTETDTTFNEFVQIAGAEGEVELFDRSRNITVHLPLAGGWVSVDSGGGSELANMGVRVTTVRKAAPSPLPECDVPVMQNP
jgi:hypothetical protein